MAKYYDIIRVNIRKFRLEKEMTQKRLAELSGLSKDYIGEIESLTKHKTFSIDALERISDAMGIEIKLFFDKEN